MSKATLDDEYVNSNRTQDKADTQEQCLDYDGREFRWDKSDSSHIKEVDEELKQESNLEIVFKYEFSTQNRSER